MNPGTGPPRSLDQYVATVAVISNVTVGADGATRVTVAMYSDPDVIARVDVTTTDPTVDVDDIHVLIADAVLA